METLFDRDETSYPKSIKSIAAEFDKDSTRMENAIKAIGGKCSSDIDDAKTYIINALPNVSLLLKVEKKWTGKYKSEFLYEENSYELFGERFMRDICITFLDFLKL